MKMNRMTQSGKHLLPELKGYQVQASDRDKQSDDEEGRRKRRKASKQNFSVHTNTDFYAEYFVLWRTADV